MSIKENFSLTHVAAESLDTYVGVELDGSNPPKVQTPDSAGNEPTGIVNESADADGDAVSVVVQGPTRLTAAGSINEGEWIALDTDGKGTTATSADYAVGRALEDASSGDHFEVLTVPQVNDKD